MVATNSLSTNLILPHRRLSFNPFSHNKKRFMLRKLIVNAKQGENERELTEKNMVVLRMRIKKMKVMDAISCSDASASSDWKDWEKKLFSHYHEDVCEVIELLQSYLMNTGPSVALGMVALMAMCVPVSTSTVVFNALKVAKGLLAGCHICIDIDF